MRVINFGEQDLTLYYATGTTGTIGRHLPRKFQSCDVDLASHRSINKLVFEQGSRLLHLGGIVGTEQVRQDLELSFNVNVRGSLLLAQKFLESDGDLFIYVSSSHVYRNSRILIDEDSPIDPISIYAEQKVAAEVGLQELFYDCKEKLSIIRVFSILDWDVKPFTLGGVVRKIIEQKNGVSIQNSDDVRDFTTPGNAALILSKITDVRLTGITNLCTGIGRSVSTAVAEMLRSSNYEVPEEVFVSGYSKVPYLVGNPRRLINEVPNINLDWEPKLTLH